MIVTYNGNTYSWDPSTNGCDATPDPSSYTCSIGVNDSGCPDHLRVIADDPTPYTCPVSGIRVARRRISYYVVDDNENVVPNVQVGEALSPTTTNTCGNGYPSATPCSLYPSGAFTDTLSVYYCGGGSSSCGLSLNQQLWWCPKNTAIVRLATLDGDQLYSDHTTVLGHTMPGGSTIPAGTDVYP